MNRISKKKTYILLATLFGVVVIFAVLITFANSRFNALPQFIASTAAEPIEFPKIDETNLSDTQRKVVTVLRAEYELQPDGTKYSDGIKEPWCADFVSWVFKEAGVPLSNPNSGYWRIPGTYTLREYYESVGKFEPADSEYRPKVGDILLYDNPSSFGQHTNIVIEVSSNTVTTIGGNEPGGIRILEHSGDDSVGFVGYGTL